MGTTDASAALPDKREKGIWIQAPAQCQERDGLPLRGEYKVPYADASVPKQAVLMPRHIALVVTHYGQYAALKPFQRVAVFEDDVKDDGEIASGHFNLNVFDHIPFDGTGDYYILCSLGDFVSNIVRVKVT